MATYDEQNHNTDAVCPYCGDSYQVEGEDYSEDSRQEECGSCGKKYWLCQIFTVDHQTTPDCELNGESHQFERVKLRSGKEADFCTVCNHCRSVEV